MKKRILSLVCLVLCLSLLAGCGMENLGESLQNWAEGFDGFTIPYAPGFAPTVPQTTVPAVTQPVQTVPTEPVPTEPLPTVPQVTEPIDMLIYAEGTVLRMACGYNNAKTGMFFNADVARDGIILSDGRTYHAGDLKPTWEEVENRLGIRFHDQFQGNSATNEFKYWAGQLNNVDMVSVNLNAANQAGNAGELINIAEHLDKMPNFKAFLDANPIVRLSITGNTDTGAIYVSPYFDGVSDVERMPLMRTDWIMKLLDGEGQFSAAASNKLAAPVYTPYMPTSGKVFVDVVKLDGTAVQTIAKNYDTAGNIIATMNAAGSIDGVTAVNMLRKYIDEAYNGYYGTYRSNLFVGQNAAWDADELVALLRCVVANPQTLNGTSTVYGLFSREDSNNQRRVDMYRFAGTLFGVRGLESRQDYLYIGSDGNLHDARQEPATYQALERMHAMAQEGLIAKSFLDSSEEKSATLLENDMGFMHYDYNQTQTIYNSTTLQPGEYYRAAMIPVARWNDGTGEKFFRFTESWRSVKTDGWAISASGISGNQDKLNAALALIDYAYSPAGMVLMSYGPDDFIKTNADGSYVTFNFNGQEMPVISDAAFAELQALTGGNYTNYARQYLGSTLSFVKLQAFEYQCTNAVGQKGAGFISNAIALGTIKHPELTLTENPWYTSIPTILPNTADENATIAGLADLRTNFGTAKNQQNILVDQIVGGYTQTGMGSAEQAANYVAQSMGGSQYLSLKEAAWERLESLYNYVIN